MANPGRIDRIEFDGEEWVTRHRAISMMAAKDARDVSLTRRGLDYIIHRYNWRRIYIGRTALFAASDVARTPTRFERLSTKPKRRGRRVRQRRYNDVVIARERWVTNAEARRLLAAADATDKKLTSLSVHNIATRYKWRRMKIGRTVLFNRQDVMNTPHRIERMINGKEEYDTSLYNAKPR